VETGVRNKGTGGKRWGHGPENIERVSAAKKGEGQKKGGEKRKGYCEAKWTGIRRMG